MLRTVVRFTHNCTAHIISWHSGNFWNGRPDGLKDERGNACPATIIRFGKTTDLLAAKRIEVSQSRTAWLEATEACGEMIRELNDPSNPDQSANERDRRERTNRVQAFVR
jgi:hypothetical protein